jgi:PAS domain S-box-containing protein
LLSGDIMTSDKMVSGHSSAITREILEMMVAEASLGFGYLDRELRYVFLNQELANINGIPVAEHSGRYLSEIVPSLMPGIEKVINQILVTGKPVRNRHCIGQTAAHPTVTRYFKTSWYPVYDEGVIGGFCVIVADITRRKKTEIALVKRTKGYKEITQNVRSVILRWKMNGAIVFINEYGEALFGYNARELIGKNVNILVPEHDSAGNDQELLIRDIMEDPGIYQYNVNENIRKDGKRIWVSWINNPILDETGEVKEVVAVGSDITHHILGAKLRQSEERLRAFINASSDVAYMVDPDLNNMKILHGRHLPIDMDKMSFSDRYEKNIPPEDQPRIRAVINKAVEAKSIFEMEHRVMRPDGTCGWMFSRAVPILDEKGNIREWFGASTDITEQKLMQEQLRESQKMQAIGSLAGGIAHDFNNILAAIIGFSEMAIDDVTDGFTVEKNLRYILKSAIRGRDLVKQILVFGRKTNPEREALSLSPLIKETIQFLRVSISANIGINLSITTSSDTVVASPTEIQQILMNLGTNAALAIEEKGGTVDIVLSDIDCAPGLPILEINDGAEEYVQLMVKDTGIGMNSDIMKRIFEPFFTTRGPGAGTGMGLAVVYGIVNDLCGAITVESQPGVGSIFRVLLPKAKDKEKKSEVLTGQIPKGTESILFVDDEDMLVEWAEASLTKLGYRVTALSDPVKALTSFSSDPSRFDLVITDQSMPSMLGIQLAQELLALRPDIPIILCTGRSETTFPESAKEAGIRRFLMKPLTKRELAMAIRSVLG